MSMGGRLVLVVAVLLPLLSMATVAWAGTRWMPPDDTITHVSGTADRGFHVERHDGSQLWTPTQSEAVAECGEYDRLLARARCRVQVRTWYRDLGDTKRALRYARLYGEGDATMGP